MNKRFQKQPVPRRFRPAPLATFDLQNAIALHQRGQMVEAERIYRNILKASRNHFDAQHLLGILKHEQGRNAEALGLIGAALKEKPNEAAALANYGVVCNALKRFDEALACCDKAIALKPDFEAAFNNRGLALYQLKRFDEALASYDKAVALKPDFAEAFCNRGLALYQLKRFDEALASFDKAVALKPRYANAFYNRGNALRELKRFDEALASYDKAVALKPDFAEAFYNRGFALYQLTRFDEALASFDKAVALKPRYANAFNNRGNALRELKRFDEALASFDKAVALKPDFAEAFCNRGFVLGKLKRFDEALASYDKALAIKPDFVEALNDRAIEMLVLGRLAEAQRDIERAIQLAPRNPRYYYTLGQITRYVAADPRVAAMEELVHDATSLAIDDRINLHFALAKAYEDLGRPERAFSQLLAGNALKRSQITYEETITVRMHSQIQEAFIPELLQTFQNVGEPSRVPIFIVGMPRSGTTLIEQILASHPDVFGGGELDFLSKVVADIQPSDNNLEVSRELLSSIPSEQFRQIGESYLAKIKRLAPAAARVVDKMPANYLNVGLIHLALPNAPIIHVVRDPVDTCISCFSQLFTGELNYTYDLAELGRYYGHYQALMAHWHRVLPLGRILDVRYEEVVANLEGMARRIVAHCGLEWDAHCLAFHQTKRPIRTASVTQVRRPIYKSSMGHRFKYETFLAPLLAELSITRSSDRDR
jgi:tetratricopeptide (TPR) repeat protein